MNALNDAEDWKRKNSVTKLRLEGKKEKAKNCVIKKKQKIKCHALSFSKKI